jgi:hypothetical protein
MIIYLLIQTCFELKKKRDIKGCLGLGVPFPLSQTIKREMEFVMSREEQIRSLVAHNPSAVVSGVLIYVFTDAHIYQMQYLDFSSWKRREGRMHISLSIFMNYFF